MLLDEYMRNHLHGLTSLNLKSSDMNDDIEPNILTLIINFKYNTYKIYS